MKKGLLIISLAMMIFNIAFSQRVVTNNFFPDVDEPLQFNKSLIKNNFHIIKFYKCRDTIFKPASCICTRKEIYNDSGRIINLIAGNDLEHNQVNYEVNYLSTTDSICKVSTEYKAHYVDSVSLFMIDTVINKKYTKLNIYTREKNKNLIVNSTLFFTTRNIYPDTIFRYNKTGELKEIYYPLGNRIIIKEWIDTTMTGDTKKVFSHTIYPENQFHSYTIYSKRGIIIEDGNTNVSNDSSSRTQKNIYVYNDSSKLISKLTVDENNVFISDENYFYKNNSLIKDSLNFESYKTIKEYDEKGKILMLLEQHSGDRSWKWNYIYKEDLQERTDYFWKNKYQNSTFFLYSIAE